MPEKKTGLSMPAGILQPTTPLDDPLTDEGQGGSPARDDGPEAKLGPKAARKNKVSGKASSGKVEGRKLYLPEDIHFRLRMLAYQRGQKLSECAVEVLDKGLPRWNVDRIG
jgi:hypothetical protein